MQAFFFATFLYLCVCLILIKSSTMVRFALTRPGHTIRSSHTPGREISRRGERSLVHMTFAAVTPPSLSLPASPARGPRTGGVRAPERRQRVCVPDDGA